MISLLADLESKPVSCLTTTSVQNPCQPMPPPATPEPGEEAATLPIPGVRLRSQILRLSEQDWFTLEPKHLLDTGRFSVSTNLTEAS